ncbi:MAG: chitin deacetylase [Stictis urceolatum]|nr:chitin deacetylase [Stictis urceolata]
MAGVDHKAAIRSAHQAVVLQPGGAALAQNTAATLIASGDYTSDLLDVLKSYGFTATFFITGNNIGKGPIDTTAPYPSLIKRMIAEGHQVASHTWSHYNLSGIGSGMRMQQMGKNERAIANIIGKYPTYMRPPYSECTQQSGCWADLKKLGYHRTYFDLDTQDYLNPLPTQIQNSKNIVENYLAAAGVTGYLSIQHDIVEQSVHNLTTYYYDAIKAKGWKGVTVGECMNDPQINWYRTPGGSSATASPASVSSATKAASTTASPTVSTSVSKVYTSWTRTDGHRIFAWITPGYSPPGMLAPGATVSRT